MNVNVAGRFRISGGIQVPLGPIRLSISQIEVLRALHAESLRGCSPPFGFLLSEFGSHMCHIIKSQVAFLQRHGHPVHTFRDDSFCANNSGGYDTSCSHSHEARRLRTTMISFPVPSTGIFRYGPLSSSPQVRLLTRPHSRQPTIPHISE